MSRPRRVLPSLEKLEHRSLLAAAPTVLSVLHYGFHTQPTVLVLQFSEPMNPGPAENPRNYVIRNHKSLNVNVGSAVYDAATQSVVLTLRQQLNVHHPAALLVIGNRPGGLVSTSGIPLNGANTAQPGSSFSTFINRAILAGPSPPPLDLAATNR